MEIIKLIKIQKTGAVQYFKIAIIFLLRAIKKIFYIFPICENRIIFISQRGTQYSCNPKYLFEYIYKKYGNKYQYIWCLNDKKLLPKEFINTKRIEYLSIKYIWYTLTSKYYISNVFIEPIIPGRKGQVVINTWHGGGAYKRIDIFASVYSSIRQYGLFIGKIRAEQTSYYIASCKKFEVCLSKDFNASEKKFLPIGMPRNDILFSTHSFKEKIKNYYNIDQALSIVLYAPTFRGIGHNPEAFNFTIKIDELIKYLEIKFFKKFILLYRGHHYFINNCIPSEIINASDYPDMQELLCAADVLITDYSSSMWDFSLMYKPCFIYAPDVKKYQAEQGFYTPVEKWPFPFAETNEELMEKIFHFDEGKYRQTVKKHHEDLGSYETGKSCEQFCRIIFGPD